MATDVNGAQRSAGAATCPNCVRLQQTADHRWIEVQDLRARVLGLETVLSEYVWLVSEAAADELDPESWNSRVEQAKTRAVALLDGFGVASPASAYSSGSRR